MTHTPFSKASACWSPAAAASSARISSIFCCEDDCSQIVVVDNMVRGRPGEPAPTRCPIRGSMLVEGDIRDARADGRLVAGCDTVFHQAALRITHCAAEPDPAMAGHGRGDLRLCCSSAWRTASARWSIASSASIYGLAPHFPTPKSDHPYDNRTLYGAAKAFGEGLLRSFNDMYGLDYVALRYFNVYGPRMDLHGKYTEVMVRWMERIERGEPPIVFGDGLQTMDMIHVRDVARANILAAQAAGHRRGVQRRQRDRDLAAGPGAAAVARYGPARSGAGPPAGAGGQSRCRGGWPMLGKAAARCLGFRASDPLRRRAARTWSTGGGRTAATVGQEAAA